MRSQFRNRFEYLLLLAFAFPLKLLPRTLRGAVGAGLGQLVYSIGIRRDVTIANLKRAFPTLPERALKALCARVYKHFGRVAVSFVALSKLSREDEGRWIFIEGWDVLESALKGGKGCITVSGHLGNWEIMGCMVARCGFPATFVVASQSNDLVEAYIDRARIKAGVEIIKKRDALRGVLTALKNNRLVAMLIDQDAHEEGAFVPFFGELASTPRGPAVFHLRTGAPLVFVESHRLPGEKYLIRYSRFDTTPYPDADALTAALTARLEQAIRETPEQWFWMHRRWKTRPPAF
jgi:Kdo2-lipid IVA lauroyltransferase/acyltransferase